MLPQGDIEAGRAREAELGAIADESEHQESAAVAAGREHVRKLIDQVISIRTEMLQLERRLRRAAARATPIAVVEERSFRGEDYTEVLTVEAELAGLLSSIRTEQLSAFVSELRLAARENYAKALLNQARCARMAKARRARIGALVQSIEERLAAGQPVEKLREELIPLSACPGTPDGAQTRPGWAEKHAQRRCGMPADRLNAARGRPV